MELSTNTTQEHHSLSYQIGLLCQGSGRLEQYQNANTIDSVRFPHYPGADAGVDYVDHPNYRTRITGSEG